MKDAFIRVKRLADNKYQWETNTQEEKIIPQTECLLLIGGVIAAAILNGMQIGDDLTVDLNIKKM